MQKDKKTISHFFNKKTIFVKKIISILFCFLSLSSTFNVLAYAQEMQTTQSQPLAVGFGKDGKLLQAINSNYLAVGINNPTPSILSSDPESLPPVESEIKVKLYGGGFTEKTNFSLVNENLEPLTEALQADISSETQTDLTFYIPPSEIQRGKLTFLAQNKDIKDGSDLKSNLFNIPLDYSAPTVINKGGKSLVHITPSVGVAPQIVTFDASGVVNPDDIYLTNPQGLKYKWDVGENSNALENPVATYTYTKPGKYTATFTVENAYGKTSTVKKEIEIRDKNEAPNVNTTYTSSETDDYLEVSFDASMSIDPESDPISFDWDLDDGTTITDKTFTYKFTKKGTYIPKVIVTDSLGAQATKYLEPITYLGPNIPPTPIANISPSEGYLSLANESSNVYPRLLIKLQAKDSFDKDGEIKNYKWTISGNSLEEIREGNEATHEFTQAGTYKVKLAVTDNRNRTAEKEETITVKNPDPIASADIDKTSGNSPLSVQFNSNGSRDFDGSLVNVKWNFGDGTTDSIEPNPIHTYNKPGAYLATLTVTAPDGRTKKTNTKTILVNENNGPVGIISTLEPVQLGIPNEGMIKLSAKESYDPEFNQMLSYSWSWIAQQLDKDKNLIDISEVINKETKENISEEFSYTFIAPGQYTPVLEVKTEDGRISKLNGETITIVPGQEPVAIANITSDKLQGIDSLSVMFDASGSYDPKADGSLISYFWEFGDGSTSSEITPEHTYNTPGEYNAKLTIQDSRGFKSTALANTVRVTLSSDTQALKSRVVDTEKTLLLQVADETASESTLSFSSDEEKPIDNTPPQISLSISNPDVKAGETLSLSAHITDDISVETVGYKLLDENNNIILEELESAPGNNQIDEFMANVDYTKDILIPQNTPLGKYKLLLFAKDKSDNWIGKIDSSQIISSEITITESLEDTSNIVVSSEDLDEKPDASVISELDEALQETTDEERKKLLELVASDKENDTANSNTIARKYLKERESVNDIQLKARRSAPNVNVGSPPAYGAPSVMSHVTSVSPTISSVMTSQTSTPYIDVSLMTVVNSNTVKNFSHVQISVSPSATAQSTSPQIEKTITISCAAGRDCSIYNDRIKEIENPTISVTPQDSYGNPIGGTHTLQLDLEETNNIKPPVIDSLEVTSRERGLGAFNLKVTGSMFNETSYILWDGNKLETNYKDPHKLVAFVPATFTFDSKIAKIQIKKQKDGNSYFSNILNFEVLPKPNDKRFLVLNTPNDITQEISGNDRVLERSGGNVYIDNTTTTFKDAGDITLPFVISHESNLNLEVIGSIISSSQNPLINLYHNNKLVTSLIRKEGANSTKSKSWKVNFGTLPPGGHTIRLSVPDLSNKTIFALDRFKFGFSEVIRPRVTSISPKSIYPPNESDRTITLTGTNFGKNPKVLFSDELLSTTTIVEEKKIEVKLPVDLKLEPDQKNLSIQVLNTQSNEKSETISIGITSKLDINSTTATYTFNPGPPNGELKVNLNTTNNSDTAYIGVFDKGGRIVKEPYHEGKTNTPLTSFILPYNLKSEKYHVISLLERKNTNVNINDYSNKEVKKLFDDLVEKKVNDFNQRLALIPDSHKITFEIGNYSVPTLKLNGASIINETNTIQENQELGITVELKGNITDKSKITIKTNFGDGAEIIGENPKHTYKLGNSDKNKYFEIITRVIQDSIEIGSSVTGVRVYKDLPPVAVAVIDTENFSAQGGPASGGELSGDAPFKSGFVDKSYDPNDELTNFNGLLDKTTPEQNIWKLFKYKDGISNQLVNTEDLSVVGNEVKNSGKSFITGNILNPGTYYAQLTVFDRQKNSDSTQSETIQITLPTQKLLVHGGFTNPSNQAFEYDSEGKVKVNFMSNVQIRGNKQPKNILYKWDFGDGSTSSEPNPLHTYKQSMSNKDKIDYHPELTVTAIWANGYSETWSSKAGTVSIIDKPEFVALDIVPDTTIGNVPLTVNFMVSDKSFAKNATIVSYSFDYGDTSEIETSAISSLDELKQKTFTHTYNTRGDFSPVLKVKIKENLEREISFNSPIISTNQLLISSIEVIEPQDNYITNQPIQTFKINTIYTNPFSEKNRLTFHVIDEENNETVTELNPDSSEQTISLSEGVNSYWFEARDSSGNVIKSEGRIIKCDLTNPSLQVFSPGNKEVIKNESLKIFGSSQDENLDHIEYQIDNNPPVVIIEDDLRIIEIGNVVFFKEIGNLINGKHILKVRAIDKAGNTTEERFNIGVGNDTFIFSRLFPLRNNFDVPIVGNNDGEEGFKVGVGSPFKIQTSVRFYGDTVGKNDSYADVILKSNGSHDGNESATLDKELFETNSELLETHNVFQGGDLDGPSPNTNIIYRSSLLNQKDFTKSLFNTTTNKNIASAWELGNHNIKFNVGVTSPTGGVSLVKLNDPTDISTQLEQNYNIEITRPVEVLKSILSPEITLLNNYTNYTATIKVKDFLTFNNLDRNIKLLLDQTTLTKPQNSKTEIENLKLIENSYVVNSNNDRLASVNISFNLKPDILPSKDEKYELTVPIQLAPDSKHINGYLTKAKIEIPVQGEFPAIIETPTEGEIVTSQNITSAKLLGAANNINTFEKQNVYFALSIGEKDLVKIKANSGNEQIIRITEQNKINEDISFEAKVPFDLLTLSDFKDLFLTGEAFGPIELYSTYTNAKNNTSFNGKPKKLLLLDNPLPVIKQTTLKKDKNNVVLKLLIKNNTVSDEILVKFTPYNSNGEAIEGLSDSITNQLFSFIGNTSNPQLTQTKKILLPLNTEKVKIEVKRSDNFLNTVKEKLPLEWKDNFILKAREEETKYRIFIISLNSTLKSDCEAINELLNSKINISQEVNALKELAGCEAEKTFFTENSQETDSIKLPFVTNGTASIPDDIVLGITSVSFPFTGGLTLKEFKQLLKDLKLLNETNNNGFDLETQEATYELLRIIDNSRCTSPEIISNPSLRKQTINLQCGISTSNYLEYISTSIQQNLPVIILIKALIDQLKTIGAQSPPASIDLPDSIIFRTLANEEALLPLPPWAKAALWLGSYIVTTALLNQKVKTDFFEQVKDSTCTRTFGSIDRRFIIGKDLNNLDRMRTNTMAGIVIEGLNVPVKIVEPFPHIPQYPGIYSTCLPEGTHTITLQFNNQNTFSMSITVPTSSNLSFVEPFIGGVFRKYARPFTIPLILDSRKILNTPTGDLRKPYNPAGSGAYLTNFSLKPGFDTSPEEIARKLRLFQDGSFEPGNINSIGTLEPDRARAFIDLAVNYKANLFDFDPLFPFQFVLPYTEILFGKPGETNDFILIDEYVTP